MSACVRIAVVAIGLAEIAAAASAEPVYRCGSTYSHAPCAGGTAATKKQRRDVDERDFVAVVPTSTKK